MGHVAGNFDRDEVMRRLPGRGAIGHVRYSTTGASEWENTQPIVRDDRHTLALAHNGNLINAVELHAELREHEIPFSSTSDSEIIAALLSTHPVGRYGWAAVQATLAYLLFVYVTHQRLQPWCPKCRNGGEEVRAPIRPVSPLTRSRRSCNSRRGRSRRRQPQGHRP